MVLTSNAARELSDALKRRCLHLYIDLPDAASASWTSCGRGCRGVAEQLAQKVVAAVQAVRKLDLKKAPSISETLDWARALTLLNATTLEPELVAETLSTILKYEADIAKAKEHLAYIAGAEFADGGRRFLEKLPRCLERGFALSWAQGLWEAPRC